MTTLRLLRLLPALALFVILARNLPAGEIITVTTAAGRTHTAAVDERTDKDQLWLRFGDRITTVLRPIAWSHVASAQIGDRTLTAAELQAAAEDLATRIDDLPPPPTSRNARRSAATDRQRAQQALGLTPPIQHIEFDAAMSRWDAESRTTGLAVQLYAIDRMDRVRPVAGVLTVKLLVPRARNFNAAPHSRGRTTEILGRWTVPVRSTDGSATIKLPYRPQHPELDDRWAPYGRVEIEFTVPGQGVFRAAQDYVRVRPMSADGRWWP